MPITGPASYLPTTSEFLDHWEDANAALGVAGPLILRKETLGRAADVARGNLLAMDAQLVTQHATVQAGVVEVDLASGALADLRVQAHAALNMFNEKVRALLANTRWERALSDVPGVEAGQGPFMEPLNGTQALWDRINTDEVLGTGVELVLRDGMTGSDFYTLVQSLDPAYRAVSRAGRTLKLEREKRNDMQAEIYPILKQYRVAVPGYFAPGSAIMASLPRLTPEPGHTPAPVNASVVWDAAEVKARIEWEASEDADLYQYEVRYSPGTTYHEEDEDVIGNIAPGDPRVFLTNHALTLPGAKALFRVYVILNTGNERGGSTLEVTRPEA